MPAASCFFLADQSFPAALPAGGSGRCCAVLRIEDGSLLDLLAHCRKLTDSSKIPVGTVLVVSSLSQLRRAGTTAYASDLMLLFKTVEEDYGGRIRVVHGLPLPPESVEDPLLARSLFDILAWLQDVDKRGRHSLQASYRAYVKNILKIRAGEGANSLATITLPMRLPCSVNSRDLAAFESGGSADLAGFIRKCTDRPLDFCLGVMLQELNQDFGLDLDPAPETNLDSARQDAIGQHPSRIIIAGGSHAARLANAIGQYRPDIVDLSTPGWKITTENVRRLASDLADSVNCERMGEYIVIFQLFDNDIVRGRLPDGTLQPAFKQDSKYHVEGSLEIVGKEFVRDLLNQAAPLFKAVQGANTFVLGPMPRYLAGPCCQDPAHVTNQGDRDYSEKLAIDVSSKLSMFS